MQDNTPALVKCKVCAVKYCLAETKSLVIT